MKHQTKHILARKTALQCFVLALILLVSGVGIASTGDSTTYTATPGGMEGTPDILYGQTVCPMNLALQMDPWGYICSPHTEEAAKSLCSPDPNCHGFAADGGFLVLVYKTDGAPNDFHKMSGTAAFTHFVKGAEANPSLEDGATCMTPHLGWDAALKQCTISADYVTAKQNCDAQLSAATKQMNVCSADLTGATTAKKFLTQQGDACETEKTAINTAIANANAIAGLLQTEKDALVASQPEVHGKLKGCLAEKNVCVEEEEKLTAPEAFLKNECNHINHPTNPTADPVNGYVKVDNIGFNMTRTYACKKSYEAVGKVEQSCVLKSKTDKLATFGWDAAAVTTCENIVTYTYSGPTDEEWAAYASTNSDHHYGSRWSAPRWNGHNCDQPRISSQCYDDNGNPQSDTAQNTKFGDCGFDGIAHWEDYYWNDSQKYNLMVCKEHNPYGVVLKGSDGVDIPCKAIVFYGKVHLKCHDFMSAKKLRFKNLPAKLESIAINVASSTAGLRYFKTLDAHHLGSSYCHDNGFTEGSMEWKVPGMACTPNPRVIEVSGADAPVKFTDMGIANSQTKPWHVYDHYRFDNTYTVLGETIGSY